MAVVLNEDPAFKPKVFEIVLTDGSVDGCFRKALTVGGGVVLTMACGEVLTRVWAESEIDDMLTWIQKQKIK
ncbi:hypothetical protein HanXRQr2_Chr01g0036661 [Helianthus annuus]|uniref:Uncharacterized protein n=1 Tax=Helianthus annuus TaxID=4232 RepID=A0A9K3P3F7_HELAN|nr:hypothetical protein HanXRQr2_Chr01g0036661 [Helianthus annuus]